MLPANTQNYRHISFDLWLTLIKSNPQFKQKRNECFADFFHLKADPQNISEVVRYYDVFCNACNEKTGLNMDTYQIYLLILQALGLPPQEVELAQLDAFYQATEQLFLDYKPQLIYPETLAYFQQLKAQGISLSVLSNTGFIKSHTLGKILDFYGLSTCLDFCVYSDVCQISKPNPRIFDEVYQRVLQQKNISKSQILHVGDNPYADQWGAQNYGFASYLISH
jgi:putative hydrolase of the HAD superfamily